MRLHKNLVWAVIDALEQIFINGQYADKVIARVLKSNPTWGGRDRAFIAENTYDIVRYYRLYAHACQQSPETFDAVALLAAHLLHQGIELPTWFEVADFEPEQVLERLESAMSERAISASVPDWLDQMGVEELGLKKWEEVLGALNQTAPMTIRVNTLKTTRVLLQNELAENNWDTQVIGDEGLVFKMRGNLFLTSWFKEGYFELQDAGSQKIAPFVDVEPGIKVIDACAGGGGKTLHLAALMQNKGKIIAMDTYAWKLDELKIRARRANTSIVETRLITSTKTVKRLYDSADRVLLDVPCSGTGVIARNPDAKWKLAPSFIENLKTTQQEILTKYAPMVKVGGYVVYATCSIFPSENEKQVQDFLKKFPDTYELVAEKNLLPSEQNDGFYMAKIKRLA